MKVVRAKSAGFCWGVRRAVAAAEKAAADGEVFTDGPLIHNRGEIERLEKLGVKRAADSSKLPHGATLLVRAHGVPPERLEGFEKAGLNVIDATCPNVLRVQAHCARAAGEGRRVVILGDPDHAEVIGLLGHARGRGAVVTSPADVDALPPFAADEPAPILVSQTTQARATFDATAAALIARRPDAEIVNTICAATSARQGELATLAEQCDAIVVVGSPESANSQRLAALAGKLKPAILIDGAADLDPAKFAGFKTVGLTAGASTPDSIIDAVEARLQAL